MTTACRGTIPATVCLSGFISAPDRARIAPRVSVNEGRAGRRAYTERPGLGDHGGRGRHTETSREKFDDVSGLLAALESERGRYEYRVGRHSVNHRI